MTKVISEKIYLLGSRLDNEESIIIEKEGQMKVASFASLEEAKALFIQAYDLLLAPSFTPSFPPSREEMIYHQGFMKLISFYPVIVELDKENYLEQICEWKEKDTQLFQTQEKFYGATEYYHLAMRSGFLKEYGVLDIAKDIESTPFIRSDGQIVLRINRVGYSDSFNSQQSVKPFSEEEINEILRKRGFL